MTHIFRTSNTLRGTQGRSRTMWTATRSRLPLLVLAATALVVVGIAAGQAIGPVFGSSVFGSAGIVVEQTLVLDKDFTIEDTSASVGLQPFGEFLGVMNDEGTGFLVGLETQVNHRGEFNLPIANTVGVDAVATLTLEFPANLEVDLDADIQVSQARIGPRQWLITAGPLGGNVYVTVWNKPHTNPGFVNISGSLRQVAG